jgi:hypothetical protein
MPDNRTYCMFTNAGTVEVAEHHYGPHTVVWSDYGEEVVVFGELGAEALCIAFSPYRIRTRPHGARRWPLAGTTGSSSPGRTPRWTLAPIPTCSVSGREVEQAGYDELFIPEHLLGVNVTERPDWRPLNPTTLENDKPV